MKKKLLGIVTAVCAVLLVAVILADFIFGQNATNDFIAMNTTVSLNITGIGCKETAESIKKEIIRLDTNLLSRTIGSAEICTVNSGNTAVSDELAKLLADIKEIEKSSNGSFCSGLGTLSDLWAIGTDGARLPDESEITAALTGADSWKINGSEVTLPVGVKLDMGAVGKGIACDYAAQTVKESKCSEAIVSVGGSVMLYSSNGKQTFQVGIRNPYGQANEYCAILETAPCFISTSGNYERFFEGADGKRYHHIFNPSTGYPAESGLISVTVIADSGLVSDALSTACFVLGAEKSLPLLEKYSAEAIFITNDNKVITTFDNNSSLNITNEIFTLGEVK